MKLENFVSGEYKQQFRYKSFIPSKINCEFTWNNSDINVLLEQANAELSELMYPKITRIVRVISGYIKIL